LQYDMGKRVSIQDVDQDVIKHGLQNKTNESIKKMLKEITQDTKKEVRRTCIFWMD
jgi:hypothetical protein